MRAGWIITAIALCAGLAACGDTTQQQALYGGAAGLAGSMLVVANPVIGVAAGAAGNLYYCNENPGKCN